MPDPLKPQTFPAGRYKQTGNSDGWLAKEVPSVCKVDADYNLKAILKRSYYYTIMDWAGVKINPNADFWRLLGV